MRTSVPHSYHCYHYMHSISVLFALFCLLILPGCSSPSNQTQDEDNTAPVARGERILVVDVNEAEGEEYADVVARSRSAGANVFNISIQWDELETAPGVFEPSVDLLGIANAYYPNIGAEVSLMIGPIDTNNDRMPSDLRGRPYNDPVVIQRFRSLLDYVFSKIPDLQLSTFAIGNEVDAFLGLDADAWEEYSEFFRETSAYARQLRPGLTIGVKVTYGGLIGSSANYARTLNEPSDAILTTHYPLKDDFTVEDPEVIGDVFDKLAAQYTGHQIRFMELGYPSASVCNSSEEKQAAFIRESFTAWDRHHEQIEYISFSIMTDRSQESVEEYGRYYGITDNRFLSFLRTIGLRTWSGMGTDKKGWTALQEEAGSRGW